MELVLMVRQSHLTLMKQILLEHSSETSNTFPKTKQRNIIARTFVQEEKLQNKLFATLCIKVVDSYILEFFLLHSTCRYILFLCNCV